METALISDPSQGRRRFDPSMSRRTRKPAVRSRSDPEEAAEEFPAEKPDGRALQRVSLQELITADGGGGGGVDEDGEGGNGTVLRKLVDMLQEDKKKMVHVEIIVARDHEDLERNNKQLAIVAKQQGGEPAGMVARCVRLLADLMKARRRSSKKKKSELMIRPSK